MNETADTTARLHEIAAYAGDLIGLAGLLLLVASFFVLLGILSRVRQGLEEQARGQQQTAEALRRILDRLDRKEEGRG